MRNILLLFFCISFYSRTSAQNFSKWTSEYEKSFKEYLDSNKIDHVEGIYKTVSGKYYRLGIKKEDETHYNVIVIDSEDKKMWKQGSIKAYLEKSSSESLFSIRWFLGDKTPYETICTFQKPAILKLILPIGLNGANQECVFLKLYPADREEDNSTNKSVMVSGSGFFITSNGIICTNSHVINKAKKIQVKVPIETGNTLFDAKILLNDAKNDVAIIQIDDEKFKEIKSIPYNISEKADIGEKVFTIGYPLNDLMGDNYKVTDGIVSAKSGAGDDVRFYQISVPLQPGNSGGPLFNSRGEIIGITTAKLNGKSVGIETENVNYAVKSAYLLNLINMLPENQYKASSNPELSKELKEQIKIFKEFVCLIQVTE